MPLSTVIDHGLAPEMPALKPGQQGLAVSRCVIEAQGAGIWAEAQSEAGSDLIFTLQPAGSQVDHLL